MTEQQMIDGYIWLRRITARTSNADAYKMLRNHTQRFIAGDEFTFVMLSAAQSLHREYRRNSR